jgi:hypothetical protein
MDMRPDSGILPAEAAAANTTHASCRQLWRSYFATFDIRERRNPKLHLRHLPRRYWQYLPEKN